MVFLLVLLHEEFAGDPVLERLGHVGLAALPGAYFNLIYKNKRMDVDHAGITIHTLLGMERRYSWNSITQKRQIASLEVCVSL